jgi:DNA-binding IclR family transcriptional regulator
MPSLAVTAVERVLDILEAFQSAQQPLSLTKLAHEIGAPKSSCHAIVATLVTRGYLYSLQHPRALYPTRRMYDVCHEILRNDPFVERATPLLERLRDASKETVILGKLQGDSVIYLQVIEGLHPIRYSAKPGEFKPLHSSAIGKALLGSLKEKEMRAVIDSLKMSAITANTLTDKDNLIQDLRESRKHGYFITRGENVPDVWAVSTFVSMGAETFAVAIAGPAHRMEGNLKECANLLVSACRLLARHGAATI